MIDERVADQRNLVPIKEWSTEWYSVLRISYFLSCCSVKCDSGEYSACEAQVEEWREHMRDMAFDMPPLSTFISGQHDE